jgi:hypothetical protein
MESSAFVLIGNMHEKFSYQHLTVSVIYTTLTRRMLNGKLQQKNLRATFVTLEHTYGKLPATGLNQYGAGYIHTPCCSSPMT